MGDFRRFYFSGFILAALSFCLISTSCRINGNLSAPGLIPTTATVTATITLTPVPTLAPDFISNFENGTVGVNPNLTGSTNGFWTVNTFMGPPAAPNTIDFGSFVVSNSVPNSVDFSNFAIHVGWPSAPITLIATGGYEADQLTCLLEGNSGTYFNASSFTGIAFDYNIPADDTNTNRAVQVATINTVTLYNHFQYLLPNGSSGGWKAVTLVWNQFNCPFGSCNGALTTTGSSGNLSNIAYLQWQFSDNLAGQAVTLPGTFTDSNPITFTYTSGGSPSVTVVYGPETFTDLWVDNVQFIP
jgi:hypothetical protein